MSFGFPLLNGAWIATCLPKYLQFLRASRRPLKKIQEGVLTEIIRVNSETVFGKAHQFRKLHSAADYSAAVPVCEYEDLKPFIDRMGNGEAGVLTTERTLLFERSSGSTSASKLIPFNGNLQESFNRALHPWMADLFLSKPRLWNGPSYWVITPLTAPNEKTSGGIPIGFQADSEYFGKFASGLINRLMAVPSWLRLVRSIDNFRYITLLFLLRAGNLRLISLWNPSFLSILLEELFAWSENLSKDLRNGTVCPPYPEKESPEFACILKQGFPPDQKRSGQVKNLLAGRDRGKISGLGQALWPELELISSWTESEAAVSIPKLKEWFPLTSIQGKGLLATEGVVSVPVVGASSPVLAATSGFFEFQEGEEGEGRVRSAWEVETGGKYRVILTTHGGLYRYKLNDIVQIGKFWRRLPGLNFLGKESLVSDLCGEKLNARHVESVISAMVPGSTGAFLAPEEMLSESVPGSTGGDAPGYVLFVPSGIAEGNRPALEEKLENGLRENFHYDWCRKIGQLQKARIIILPFDSEELLKRRLNRLYQEKFRIGTVKNHALSPLKNWEKFLL